MKYHQRLNRARLSPFRCSLISFHFFSKVSLLRRTFSSSNDVVTTLGDVDAPYVNEDTPLHPVKENTKR